MAQRLSRIYSMKPWMNTNERGLRQDKRFLQQTRAASLIGEIVCIAKSFFPDVFICVHPWLKVFPLHGFGLASADALRLATVPRRDKLALALTGEY
jgi:hypothetical protein